MNCLKCHKVMEKRLVFVSRGALIKGYNFRDESELKMVNGVEGMDIEESFCKTCGSSLSMAGFVFFPQEKKDGTGN